MWTVHHFQFFFLAHRFPVRILGKRYLFKFLCYGICAHNFGISRHVHVQRIWLKAHHINLNFDNGNILHLYNIITAEMDQNGESGGGADDAQLLHPHQPNDSGNVMSSRLLIHTANCVSR